MGRRPERAIRARPRRVLERQGPRRAPYYSGPVNSETRADEPVGGERSRVSAGALAGRTTDLEPAAGLSPEEMAGVGPRRPRIARNTAIFSVATGLSRIAGLVREIVASSYFATTSNPWDMPLSARR